MLSFVIKLFFLFTNLVCAFGLPATRHSSMLNAMLTDLGWR